MTALDAPWPEAVTIDTVLPAATPGELPEAVVKQAIEAILPHAPDPVWHPVRPVLLPD